MQLLNEVIPRFTHSKSNKNIRLYEWLLQEITKNKVGNRPVRIEPRVIKRRRKPFPLLQRPRSIEKERLSRKMKRKILRSAEAYGIAMGASFKLCK